jgi:hypothetical protein
MPDSKFMKPWYVVTREQIDWNQTVMKDAWSGYDAYVADPPAIIPFVVDVLHEAGIAPGHIVIDSFGL